MTRLRIAYLMTQSLDSPLGIGRIGPLAREMVRLGHEVRVLALHPDFSSLERREFQADGVWVKYVAPMHVKKSGSRKSYYSTGALAGVVLRATWQLTRAALGQPVDVLHVCKPQPMNGLAGVIASRFRRTTLFVDCDDYEAGAGHFKAGWQKRGVACFEQCIPRAADRVTANTTYIQSLLAGWGVPTAKICYLPNGVERERFAVPGAEAVERLRAGLGLAGRKVIVFVGSLSLVSHPVNLLLEAFPAVQQMHSDAALLIVGGGEDYDRLQEQARELGIAKQVTFTGRVPAEQAPVYYRLGTVSVDPVYANASALGRLPLKLFESWAAGTPFVSADVGDRRALLGEPPAGLLAQPGSPASLAEAICRILTQPELAGALAQRGRERVQDYYWDRLAAKLEAEYLRQLNRPSRADGGGQ